MRRTIGPYTPSLILFLLRRFALALSSTFAQRALRLQDVDIALDVRAFALALGSIDGNGGTTLGTISTRIQLPIGRPCRSFPIR